MSDSATNSETLWGPIDLSSWRRTPCTDLRLATEADILAGRAVFYLQNPSEYEAAPVTLDLPRCALLREDNCEVLPVIIIQAESSSASETLLGYRLLAGGSGICTISEVTLLEAPDGHFNPVFTGFTLTLESRPPVLAPTLAQLFAAVDTLTPDGGPGFMIIEGPNESYAQAAGGGVALTAEWREYSGDSFQHWVAGLGDPTSSKEIAIQTNGCILTVFETERLSAGDVRKIMEAFARGRRMPSDFTWRDITKRFQ